MPRPTQNVAEAWGTTVDNLETTAFADGTKGDQVRDITQAVDAVIAAKDGNVYGFTDVYLEGERAFIRSQETNLGNLSADTGIYALKEALGDARRRPVHRRPAQRRRHPRPDRRHRPATATRWRRSPTPMPASRRAASRSSTSRTRCASTTS